MTINKVLLVDDSRPFNFLSKILLKEMNIDCPVTEALDGKQALELIHSEDGCPDFILLDLNMPVMDGFEFLEKFERGRKCVEGSKIFILTSSIRDEDRERAMKSPMVKGYFEKPLEQQHIDEILKLING